MVFFMASIMDNTPQSPANATPSNPKAGWRKALVTKRQSMPDRAFRNDMLQRVMRVWLIQRHDTVIGAYWPIKGEFDPLPARCRWQEAGWKKTHKAPRASAALACRWSTKSTRP